MVQDFHQYVTIEPRSWARDQPTKAAIWMASEDTSCVVFNAGSAKLEVWTTRAGVEALRDALNAALVRAQIAQDREAAAVAAMEAAVEEVSF